MYLLSCCLSEVKACMREEFLDLWILENREAEAWTGCRIVGYESEDKDWQNLASICQILWFAWAYAHVLPIEGVRQSMWKLISDFSDGL